MGLDTVDKTADARARVDVGATDAVVRYPHDEQAVAVRDVDSNVRGRRMFDRVDDGLADHEVRRHLDPRRGAFTGVGVHRHVQRGAAGKLLQRRHKAGVSQRGRNQPMREASQFVDRHLQFPLRVIDGSGKHGVGASAGTALRHAQFQTQGHQPLLRAIMEVALQTAAFGVTRRHDARP